MTLVISGWLLTTFIVCPWKLSRSSRTAWNSPSTLFAHSLQIIHPACKQSRRRKKKKKIIQLQHQAAYAAYSMELNLVEDCNLVPVLKPWDIALTLFWCTSHVMSTWLRYGVLPPPSPCFLYKYLDPLDVSSWDMPSMSHGRFFTDPTNQWCHQRMRHSTASP